MIKFLRGLSLFACAVLIVSLFCGCGEKKEKLEPTERFFINDFADVISEEDELAIYEKGKALYENESTMGAQVVAVTVDTVNGADMSEYALNLGRNWGVGSEEEDNGVVILLAVEDRNIEIAVGYGLEGALPDSKAGRMLDIYAIPYLSENDFSAGLASVYSAVVNEVYVEYGITPENYVSPEQKHTEQNPSSGSKILVSWIVLIAVVSIVMTILNKTGRGGPFGGSGLFFIGMPNMRGGSGGFGSGGFGGFSGGGGSFGGGGAGRGF